MRFGAKKKQTTGLISILLARESLQVALSLNFCKTLTIPATGRIEAEDLALVVISRSSLRWTLRQSLLARQLSKRPKQRRTERLKLVGCHSITRKPTWHRLSSIRWTKLHPEERSAGLPSPLVESKSPGQKPSRQPPVGPIGEGSEWFLMGQMARQEVTAGSNTMRRSSWPRRSLIANTGSSTHSLMNTATSPTIWFPTFTTTPTVPALRAGARSAPKQ